MVGINKLTRPYKRARKGEIADKINICASAVVRMAEETLKKAIDAVTKATDEDTKGNHAAALNQYIYGIELFKHFLKYDAKTEKIRASILEKCKEYLDRAEQLQQYLNEQKTKQAVPSDSQGSKGKVEENEESKRLKNQLKSAIAMEKSNVKWEDVAGLETAKQALNEAVIMPMKFPHIFTGKRRPWRGILLFGPPGTGKSFIAKAIASEAGDSTFISVSSSDIVSKWLGESERLVKELFALARENKPSIIFIDEIDSLCSARNENENESARRIKTEFLVQMDGASPGTDNTDVLVLGATNMPWSLDSAIRRRFEKRIYIPLPDSAARLLLFQKNIGDTPNTLTYDDYVNFARLTEHFSGADISIIVREALMEPVRTIQSSTHFKEVYGISGHAKTKSDYLYTPCLPSDPQGVEMRWLGIPGDKLLVPPVSVRDILKAISRARPTVSKEECERLKKFCEGYGAED